MRFPLRKVHFWTLIVFAIPFTILYNQRANLTAAFVGELVTNRGWLPSEWIYSELVMGLMGSFSVAIAWCYTKMYGWRHKAEGTKELAQLDDTLKTLNSNITSLNDNIYKQFKWFNPVLEREGLTFELDEVGKITLRELAIQKQQKDKLLAEKKQELAEIQKQEITD